MALYKLFFSFLSPAKIQEKIKIFFYKNRIFYENNISAEVISALIFNGLLLKIKINHLNLHQEYPIQRLILRMQLR